MKNMIKLFSFLFVFVATSQAHARIMVEPYLGYELGSTLKLESGGVDDGGKTTGVALGARLAYALPAMVWFGLDYSMVKDATLKGNSSVNDAKVDRSNLFFDVGVDLPVLARVWAGYGLMNSSKYKFDGGTETTLKNGTTIKMGVGFTALPLVSINVEVFSQDFKDYESGSNSGSVGDVWDTHKETGVLLSVSAPFKF
jgi:hypothetical protein